MAPEQEKPAKVKGYHSVPLNFEDNDEYVDIWEPLFFLEAKAQIKKGELTEVTFLENTQ
jgi:hypothetical protein